MAFLPPDPMAWQPSQRYRPQWARHMIVPLAVSLRAALQQGINCSEYHAIPVCGLHTETLSKQTRPSRS